LGAKIKEEKEKNGQKKKTFVGSHQRFFWVYASPNYRGPLR